MSRRTRPIPFARVRVDLALRDLRARPATEWPKHLRLAWEILIHELDVAEGTALTGLVEPWSERYDGNQRETAAKLYEAHAQLPKDIRKSVGPAARRSDVECLVSDDHVRKALARLKKHTVKHRKPSGRSRSKFLSSHR
jgi:hypothetical protein